MIESINARQYRKIVVRMARDEEPGVVVEVGVYAGELSRLLVKLPTLSMLTLVDSWKGSYMDLGQRSMTSTRTRVRRWAKRQPKVKVLHMDSMDAVHQFDDESIDFWHTDGDHSHDGTYDDIVGWWPKVKPGCIMCGDNLEIPTVRTAITQAALDMGCEWSESGRGRIWWLRKP